MSFKNCSVSFVRSLDRIVVVLPLHNMLCYRKRPKLFSLVCAHFGPYRGRFTFAYVVFSSCASCSLVIG